MDTRRHPRLRRRHGGGARIDAAARHRAHGRLRLRHRAAPPGRRLFRHGAGVGRHERAARGEGGAGDTTMFGTAGPGLSLSHLARRARSDAHPFLRVVDESQRRRRGPRRRHPLRAHVLSAGRCHLHPSFRSPRYTGVTDMKRIITAFAALCTAFITLVAVAADDGLAKDLLDIQHEWEHIRYQLPRDQQEAAYTALENETEAFARQYPNRAEPLVWQAIVLSTHAGVQGSLGALSKVRAARDLLEQAEILYYYSVY